MTHGNAGLCKVLLALLTEKRRPFPVGQAEPEPEVHFGRGGENARPKWKVRGVIYLYSSSLLFIRTNDWRPWMWISAPSLWFWLKACPDSRGGTRVQGDFSRHFCGRLWSWRHWEPKMCFPFGLIFDPPWGGDDKPRAANRGRILSHKTQTQMEKLFECHSGQGWWQSEIVRRSENFASSSLKQYSLFDAAARAQSLFTKWMELNNGKNQSFIRAEGLSNRNAHAQRSCLWLS